MNKCPMEFSKFAYLNDGNINVNNLNTNSITSFAWTAKYNSPCHHFKSSASPFPFLLLLTFISIPWELHWGSPSSPFSWLFQLCLSLDLGISCRSTHNVLIQPSAGPPTHYTYSGPIWSLTRVGGMIHWHSTCLACVLGSDAQCCKKKK